MSLQLPRRLFDVDEYHRMGEVGILTDEDRVELIDGEIIEMSPIGAPHMRCVMFLTEAFVRRLEGRALLSAQNGLRLHRHSEPQPDIVLLRPPLARYGKLIPGPDDALLVVEVADTSQYRDRVVKLPRYAAAGIREVWIVDLDAGFVDVHREPSQEGYQMWRRSGRGERRARRVSRRRPGRRRHPRLIPPSSGSAVRTARDCLTHRDGFERSRWVPSDYRRYIAMAAARKKDRRRERRNASKSGAARPGARTRRWSAHVKTVSTYPPEGTFTKDAASVARIMASKKVSPKGVGSGIRMIQMFINRAGKSLSAARKRELEKAKRILQERAKRARRRAA